jgi:hypothetical protein
MKRPAIAGRVFVRNRGSLHALLCRLQTDRRLHHVVTPFRASLLSRPARESRHGVRYRGTSRRPRLFPENTLASFAGRWRWAPTRSSSTSAPPKTASSSSRMSGGSIPISRATPIPRTGEDEIGLSQRLDRAAGRPQRGLPLRLRQAVQALPMRACVRRSIDGVIASQRVARRCAPLPGSGRAAIGEAVLAQLLIGKRAQGARLEFEHDR